jgi:hypothetical protein
MSLKVPLHCGSLGLPLHMGFSVNVHLILVPHALWESMTPTAHGHITSCSLFYNMGVLDSLHVRVHFLVLFMTSCTSLCMCGHPGLPLHKGMAFYNHMLEHLSLRWASWMPTAHRHVIFQLLTSLQKGNECPRRLLHWVILYFNHTPILLWRMGVQDSHCVQGCHSLSMCIPFLMHSGCPGLPLCARMP